MMNQPKEFEEIIFQPNNVVLIIKNIKNEGEDMYVYVTT